MAILERDGASIHYTVHGSGFPVLALAPGGMRSAGPWWERSPWNPVTELAGTHRVIVMDQRNAGASTAPVTGGEDWSTYTADQLGLLDHLGVDEFAVVGMCIGGPFILGLLRAAPERVARAVVVQSIGLDGNRDAFEESFDAWRDTIAADHPEAGPEQWDAYRAGMYAGDDPLWSVPTSVLPTITAPLLVLQGDDRFHPRSASQLIASSVPGAVLVEHWHDDDLPAAREAIAGFLAPLRP